MSAAHVICRSRRHAAALAIAIALGATGAAAMPDRATFEGRPAVPLMRVQAVAAISPDHEPAPNLFQQTGTAIWDGKRTLQGIWVAHPLAPSARRVRIFNTESGMAIDGALFKRDPSLVGPSVLVSSDAAQALGMEPGEEVDLRIVALTPIQPLRIASEAIGEAGPDTGSEAGAEEVTPPAEVPAVAVNSPPAVALAPDAPASDADARVTASETAETAAPAPDADAAASGAAVMSAMIGDTSAEPSPGPSVAASEMPAFQLSLPHESVATRAAVEPLRAPASVADLPPPQTASVESAFVAEPDEPDPAAVPDKPAVARGRDKPAETDGWQEPAVDNGWDKIAAALGLELQPRGAVVVSEAPASVAGSDKSAAVAESDEAASVAESDEAAAADEPIEVAAFAREAPVKPGAVMSGSSFITEPAVSVPAFSSPEPAPAAEPAESAAGVSSPEPDATGDAPEPDATEDAPKPEWERALRAAWAELNAADPAEPVAATDPAELAAADPTELTASDPAELEPAELAVAEPAELQSAEPAEPVAATDPAELAAANLAEPAAADPTELAASDPAELAAAEPAELAVVEPAELAAAEPAEPVAASDLTEPAVADPADLAAADPAEPVPADAALLMPYVQAGIFTADENATRLIEQIEAAGLPALGKPRTLNGQPAIRVIAGPFADAAERDAALRTIRDMGLRDAFPSAQ